MGGDDGTSLYVPGGFAAGLAGAEAGGALPGVAGGTSAAIGVAALAGVAPFGEVTPLPDAGGNICAFAGAGGFAGALLATEAGF